MTQKVLSKRKDLRRFGFIIGTIVMLIFGLIPWLRNNNLRTWPWIAGLVMWMVAIATPSILNPFYKVWMKIGFILAWVNTKIILGFIYYVIITPTGFVRRFAGGDPLRRNFDNSINSYRITSRPSLPEQMEVPF